MKDPSMYGKIEAMPVEERKRLAEILRTQEWLKIDELLIRAIGNHQSACGVVREDHRYWQGCLAGLSQFRALLYQLADPKQIADQEYAAKASENDVLPLRRTSGTGAIY